MFEAESLGAQINQTCLQTFRHPFCRAPRLWPLTCHWVQLQGPKGCPGPSRDHNLPLISWFSQSLLHSPTWRAMRSDELSRGGSLNNYFALIKKGNVSLGGAALNAKVGVMDAGPRPHKSHLCVFVASSRCVYEINSPNLFLCRCQQPADGVNKSYGCHNGITYEELEKKKQTCPHSLINLL